MSRKEFADYAFRSNTRRKIKNFIAITMIILAGVIALTPLFCVFGYILIQGLPALNWQFFTELAKPVGETGGGMANAIVGTITLVTLASLLGVPWGIGIGTYLSEYGSGKRANIVRVSVDMLASVPSIVIGLFVYTLMVIPMKRFSAVAGALALAILMVPTVAKVTEELLKLIPRHIREAGLALGLPRWKVVVFIVVRGSLGTIATGVILSLARVAGETAPLLFTALSNRFWQSGLGQPIASMPVQIYNYAISPYDDWHRQAWAGAFVLVMLIFMMNILMRLLIPAKGVAE